MANTSEKKYSITANTTVRYVLKSLRKEVLNRFLSGKKKKHLNVILSHSDNSQMAGGIVFKLGKKVWPSMRVFSTQNKLRII